MMQLVVVMVTAVLITVYHPYKSDCMDKLTRYTFIFLDLGLLIALSSYQFHLTEVNLSLSIWVYVVQLILIFIPFVWITLYIGARIVAGIMNICRKPSCVVAKNEHNGEENAEERVPFKK